MDEENTLKKAELNDRIKQIRLVLFDDNNRKFASEIGEIEQTMSQICLNKRNAGLEIVQKILNSLPEIDANWLLRGKGNMTIDTSGNSDLRQRAYEYCPSNGGTDG